MPESLTLEKTESPVGSLGTSNPPSFDPSARLVHGALRSFEGWAAIPQKTVLKFWPDVAGGGPDECWSWLGKKNRGGYGKFSSHHAERYRWCLAHRFSWLLHFGPIPPGLCVLHRCDNPACVNPAHLFLGTRADNMADKVAKGRQFAKLTEAKVLEICQRYADGGVTMTQLAREYGVVVSTLWQAARGEKWAHVPGADCRRQHRAKLTEAQVLEIRQRYARGGVTQASLAREYGVGISVVGRAVTGTTWTCVPATHFATPTRLAPTGVSHAQPH